MAASILHTLICMLLIYPCFTQDETESDDLRDLGGSQILEEALSRDFIIINGHKTSLRTIFGDKLPSATNFKIGKFLINSYLAQQDVQISPSISSVNEMSAGGHYTPRIFSHKMSTIVNSWMTPIQDTPTMIADILLNTIIISRHVRRPVIMLIGDPRTGKSVALARIQEKIIDIAPELWNIRIEFNHLHPTPNYNDKLTFESIIVKFIGQDFVELFENLLKINPKRIVFLIDGIEHLTDVQMQKSIPIIRQFIETNANVIITGRTDTHVELEKIHSNIYAYEIDDMSIQETEQFLQNIWHTEMIREMPNTITREIDRFNNRLHDYTQAFANTIFKVSIPKQPMSLMVLAELFTRRKSEFFTTSTTHPATCLDYVFDESITAPSLIRILDDLILDKNILFEKITQHMRGNMKDLSEEYSYLAIAKIAAHHQEREFMNFLKLLPNFDASLTQARETLNKQKEVSTIFIKYNVNSRIQFVHSEFLNFYAAKFINSHIASNDVQLKVIEYILRYPQFNCICEYLNFQIEKLPTPPTTLSIPNFVFKIMTHSLEQRWENLFLHYLNSIIDNKMINTVFAACFHYFLMHDIVVDDTTLSKPILGMTPSTSQHPNPFVTMKTVKLPITPMELLVEYDMLKVLKKIQTISDRLWIDKNEYIVLYKELLHHAVIRPVPSLELIKFLMNNIANDLSSNDISHLLHQSIDAVGDGSQDVVNYLINCGANPKIQIQGRTLLHVAVKWNSKNLLRFIVDELYKSESPIIDSADDSGRTIFAAALDANPSPVYTFTGWWSMLSYLTDQMNFADLTVALPDRLSDFYAIPRDSVESPEFKLMFLHSRSYQLSYRYQNPWVMKITPLERDDFTEAQIQMLTRYIPYTTWSLNPNILSLRRYSWFYQFEWRSLRTVTPLEMMVHYRGVRELRPIEQRNYQKILITLLRRERDLLSSVAKFRIYNAAWKNVISPQDLIDCLQLSNVLGPSITYNEIVQRFHSSVSSWFNNILARRDDQLRLYQRLTQTRVDFVQLRFIDDDVFQMFTRIHDYLDELKYGGRNRGPLLECFRRRLKRDSVKNCLITWNDLDEFNDAGVKQRRILAHLQINSDNFLKILWNLESHNNEKARQLVNFIKQYQNKHNNLPLTGKTQMILQDVIRHGSLMASRQNQRLSVLTDDNFHSSTFHSKPKRWFLLPTRSAVLFAASTLPIIRGFYITSQLCLQHNDTSCWYSSGALAVAAASGPIGTLSIRYLPWMIHEFSAITLNALPTSVPMILRQNIEIMRNLGMKFAGKTVVYGLALAGIAFDLYNIVEISRIIDSCKREPESCTRRDIIENVISLTFSCVSIVVAGGMMMSGIGFIPGLLIGLGMLLVEEFAKGLNDVTYYSREYETNFDENFRIFWHKVALQPPPMDVQALIHRTEWINTLENQIIQLLNNSNDNIVAYAIGIGATINNNVVASYGTINMNEVDIKHTKNLSRIIPKSGENIVLLCLPTFDASKEYEKYTNEVKDAEYKCVNTFVIADRQRWQRRVAESCIIYDLGYINSGHVIGSGKLNNLYLIYNSTTALNVIGGRGNITNNFIVKNDAFRGTILLNRQSHRNILHLSDINSSILKFSWTYSYNAGTITFDNDENQSFSLRTVGKSSPNLHVIGRNDKSDNFTCNYEKQRNSSDSTLSVDGGGGSFLQLDYINDCKITLIRPFTNIGGSNSSNLLYTTHLKLLNSIATTQSTLVNATIQPLKSKFIVIIDNYPLLTNTHSVKYEPNSKTLLWNVQYTMSTTLLLIIKSYRSIHSSMEVQNSTIPPLDFDAINCVFIDNYFGISIYPVIQSSNNESTSIMNNIQQFNIFAVINSSQLNDVYTRYTAINTIITKNLSIVTKLTDSITGNAFIFGSIANDRFYIDRNTTFLFGGDGSDIYTLSVDSPSVIWIDNEANDGALDTLVIPDDDCGTFTATRGSNESNCCDKSSYDVTITCTKTQVILRNYLLSENHRHLHLFWNNAIYVLLPVEWTQKNQVIDDKFTFEHALFYSFSNDWSTTTMILTYRDTRVVFNVSDDEMTNPLVAYRSTNDMIVTRKFFNRDNSSFVTLQDFFSNHTMIVSAKWQNLTIFIVHNNMKDDVKPKILTAEDILSLSFITAINEVVYDENMTAIKEYIVNTTNYGINETIIDHNNGTTDDRLGVLMIVGSKPGDFQASINNNDSAALSLCSESNCIIIKNWCRSSRYRLYRIEFIFGFNRRPIGIDNFDQYNCPDVNDDSENQSLDALNNEFFNAQERIQLMMINNDDDVARLMRCVGSIFADFITHSMYRIFGFNSIADRAIFIHENCPILMTEKNLENLTFTRMNNTLHNAIDEYQLNEVTENEQESIIRLCESFDRLIINNCWENFKLTLYMYNKTSESNGVIDRVSIDDKFQVLLKCISQPN